MKREWKKHEKALYLPNEKPEFIEIPEMKYFVLSGEGNPNSEFFSECINALYAVAYTVKMSCKSDVGCYDYTVYPLEGVWDFIDHSKEIFDKDNLKFDLMIRQPEFLTEPMAKIFLEKALKKKKLPLIAQVRFETYAPEKCVQMLHLGSYDNESESFDKMKSFCIENGLERKVLTHREIYLTDARKVTPDKYKTVLRYTIK